MAETLVVCVSLTFGKGVRLSAASGQAETLGEFRYPKTKLPKGLVSVMSDLSGHVAIVGRDNELGLNCITHLDCG